MGKYAKSTSVSVEKSQSEVQSILKKYGANRFGTMQDEANAYLMFEYNGFMIQFNIPLPKIKDIKQNKRGKRISIIKVQEQMTKQIWRSLVLGVKAKLEFIESGVSTIEKEFMAFVIMPDGRQLGEHIIPELKKITETGKMPRMLLTISQKEN